MLTFSVFVGIGTQCWIIVFFIWLKIISHWKKIHFYKGNFSTEKTKIDVQFLFDFWAGFRLAKNQRGESKHNHPDFSLTVSSILILKDVLKSLKDRNESVRQGIIRIPDTIRIINKMMLHKEWESRSSIEIMQQRFQIRPQAEVLWFIAYESPQNSPQELCLW